MAPAAAPDAIVAVRRDSHVPRRARTHRREAGNRRGAGAGTGVGRTRRRTRHGTCASAARRTSRRTLVDTARGELLAAFDEQAGWRVHLALGGASTWTRLKRERVRVSTRRAPHVGRERGERARACGHELTERVRVHVGAGHPTRTRTWVSLGGSDDHPLMSDGACAPSDASTSARTAVTTAWPLDCADIEAVARLISHFAEGVAAYVASAADDHPLMSHCEQPRLRHLACASSDGVHVGLVARWPSDRGESGPRG